MIRFKTPKTQNCFVKHPDVAGNGTCIDIFYTNFYTVNVMVFRLGKILK